MTVLDIAVLMFGLVVPAIFYAVGMIVGRHLLLAKIKRLHPPTYNRIFGILEAETVRKCREEQRHRDELEIPLKEDAIDVAERVWQERHKRNGSSG